jgi:hypothetical protein
MHGRDDLPHLMNQQGQSARMKLFYVVITIDVRAYSYEKLNCTEVYIKVRKKNEVHGYMVQ